MMMTEKKIIPFAVNIEHRNIQLTVLKSNLASERKISEGKANVPTNVPIPFDSVLETKFNVPATYLKHKHYS